jgi:hypothetical protein
MSRLTDHARPLPASVISRCADTDGAHCAQASSAINPPAWHAVICSPPDHPRVYSWLRPCDTEEHASQCLAGLAETWLPAYAARRQTDGQWVPTGMERGVQG